MLIGVETGDEPGCGLLQMLTGASEARGAVRARSQSK